MRDELNYGTDDFKDVKSWRHPDTCLLDLALSRGSGSRFEIGAFCDNDRISALADKRSIDGVSEMTRGRARSDGSVGTADIISEEDDDVVPYGFPHRFSAGFGRPQSYGCTDPGADGGIHLLDEMSLSEISAGGGRNNNDDSASNISGLCEIEESEGNFREEIEDEGAMEKSKLFYTSHSDTAV